LRHLSESPCSKFGKDRLKLRTLEIIDCTEFDAIGALSPVHTVAEKCDCRRTVALFCDSVDRALQTHIPTYGHHMILVCPVPCIWIGRTLIIIIIIIPETVFIVLSSWQLGDE